MSEGLRLGHSPKKLDLDVIEHGIRKEAPMAPGVFFRILPWGTHNKRYKAALQEWVRRDFDEKGGTEDDFRAFMRHRDEDPEFIVKAVLADVEGLLNENGNAVQYTPERGVEVLSDPAWEHLRDWIVWEAKQAAEKWDEEVEHSGNGSKPDSRGKKAGAAKSGATRS